MQIGDKLGEVVSGVRHLRRGIPDPMRSTGGETVPAEPRITMAAGELDEGEDVFMRSTWSGGEVVGQTSSLS